MINFSLCPERRWEIVALTAEQIQKILALGSDARKLYEAGLKNIGVKVLSDGDSVLVAEPLLPGETDRVVENLQKQKPTSPQ